jgi:hypothetical protein
MDYLLSHPSRQLDPQVLHLPVLAEGVGFRLSEDWSVHHLGCMVHTDQKFEGLVKDLDRKHRVRMAFDYNHHTQVIRLYRNFGPAHTLVALPGLCHLHLLSSSALLLHPLRLPSSHHSPLLADLYKVLVDHHNLPFEGRNLLWVHYSSLLAVAHSFRGHSLGTLCLGSHLVASLYLLDSWDFLDIVCLKTGQPRGLDFVNHYMLQVVP